MKYKVKVEVPLSGTIYGGIDVLTVSPPCFYCGAEVDENHEYYLAEKKYQMRAWARSRKFGTPSLANVTRDGKPVIGKYQLKIPYCSEHIQPAKIFKLIGSVALILGFLIGLIPAVLAYLDGAEWRTVLSIGSAVIFSIVLFYAIGVGIKAIIAKLHPKYKDYPVVGRGHFGISIGNVEVKGGEPMAGPITYSLPISFSDPAAARRFIKANPSTKVTKGEELHANETAA